MLQLVIIATIGFFTTINNCECSCLEVDSSETTHYGGNMLDIYKEEKTYRLLDGKVLDSNGEPLSGVLVEVFDNPEWIKQGKKRNASNQTRISVCKTSTDGKFCFKKLPKGEYELRLSKNKNWNPTHMYIEVDPEDSNAVLGPLEVWLTIGV